MTDEGDVGYAIIYLSISMWSIWIDLTLHLDLSVIRGIPCLHYIFISIIRSWLWTLVTKWDEFSLPVIESRGMFASFAMHIFCRTDGLYLVKAKRNATERGELSDKEYFVRRGHTDISLAFSHDFFFICCAWDDFLVFFFVCVCVRRECSGRNWLVYKSRCGCIADFLFVSYFRQSF